MLTKAERETIITFDDEQQTARVYTCNKTLMKKLDAYCCKSTLFNVIRDDEWSRQYEIPKKYIAIRFPMKINDEIREQKASRARGLSAFKSKNIKEQDDK